ncbi:hypothetical protein CDAR_247261 [Caerostris darwini]|uniref:Uncharacterized protein n=1 Tax=Caerostris darwini TaxID=1538125 RepID=A0AAV4V8X2_9ARAC|nr:hypothetical protein CDAR_247261 [Caerostris darwini]
MNQQSQERILISVIHGDYHLGEWNAIASAKDISQREQEMQRFCDYGPREIFAPISAKGELITAYLDPKCETFDGKTLRSDDAFFLESAVSKQNGAAIVDVRFCLFCSTRQIPKCSKT